MFGRATITLGIGPHSSLNNYFVALIVSQLMILIWPAACREYVT